MAFASPRLPVPDSPFLPLGCAAVLAFATVDFAVAQATVIPVTAPTTAAVEAAIVAANALAFQTSAAQPVVIEFASNLIGQTIFLNTAVPILAVDWLTVRVAGAGPGARVVLDGTNTATTLRVAGRHATFRNLQFQGAGAPGSGNDVFTATGADDLHFVDCGFDGAGGNGLWLRGVLGATLQNCTFRFNTGAFVATAGSSGVVLSNCTFLANQQALLVSVADHLTVTGCTFDGNGSAMGLSPVCAHVTFGPNNVVRNSTASPAIVSSGAVFLSITGNQFTDNHHAAIQLGNVSAFVDITNNVLLRNGNVHGSYQVLVDASQDVAITGLQCRDGGGGVFAFATTGLSITGSAAQPTTIDGNRLEGIVANNCSGVTVNGVDLDHNLQGAGGAQLTVLSCSGVDVVASGMNNALGGGRSGLRIDASSNVRVGEGTSILDNGAGVFVTNSSDAIFGNWTGGGGALTVRGAQPFSLLDCPRARVGGIVGSPCAITGGTAPASLVFSASRCDAARFGPHLTIDGRGAAANGLQVVDSDDVVVKGTTIVGHTFAGFVAGDALRLVVRDAVIDGGTLAPAASGSGLLLNPGCHASLLLGNLVQRQQGNGFTIVDCSDVTIGPGNRAYGNGGDGFLVQDNGGGAATRRALLQSSAAVGQNLGGQSGVRAVHMLMNVVNFTATRHGTGVLLQSGTNATVVNTISHGNGVDRNRDPQSSGSWFHCLRGSSSGGTWSEQNTLVGVNPQFVSPATNDVRLQSGSPAIDSGLHATPVGARLPSADAASGLRIRGATIDRGAHEFVPPGGTGNTLDLAGPWLRGYGDGQLVFTIRATPAQAGQLFSLFMTGSGTGPGVLAPGGVPVPIVPDAFTGVLLGAPGIANGVLDGSGVGSTTLPVPDWIAPLLPELTFVAIATTWPVPTNPVVVRFAP